MAVVTTHRNCLMVLFSSQSKANTIGFPRCGHWALL